MSTIAFLDRTNISIAGVQIAKEFKIDNSHLGWVFSAFLVGYAGFQIPGGVILRRFGPRRVLSFLRHLVGSLYGPHRNGAAKHLPAALC